MDWLVVIILAPYLLYLFRINAGFSSIKRYRKKIEANEFVSVIIPCKNEEGSLPLLLESLDKQDYDPAKFEVIVVNDNSCDNTTSVAFSHLSKYDLKVISNTGSGKKQAIRSGVAEAKGELIITCDADSIAKSGWLSTIASFYQDKRAAMIIAPVMLSKGDGFAPWFQELEFISLQAVTAGTANNNNPVMCNGANLAFTKEAYNISSTDLRNNLQSGDDVFLMHNIKKNRNLKILWLESEDARITTKASTSFISYLSQRARWISKAGSYNDIYTMGLALSTLIAVIMQVTLLFMSITDQIYLRPFLTTLLIKSVPDFLLLFTATKRFGSTNLLRWFFPAQLIYPFYVLAIIIKSLVNTKEWIPSDR
jgi:cellulose synthase/poly-beta-1,6-N-acetylglucosamine synthase-like glycosyltransferase